jgi:hypothetical protein
MDSHGVVRFIDLSPVKDEAQNEKNIIHGETNPFKGKGDREGDGSRFESL